MSLSGVPPFWFVFGSRIAGLQKKFHLARGQPQGLGEVWSCSLGALKSTVMQRHGFEKVWSCNPRALKKYGHAIPFSRHVLRNLFNERPDRQRQGWWCIQLSHIFREICPMNAKSSVACCSAVAGTFHFQHTSREICSMSAQILSDVGCDAYNFLAYVSSNLPNERGLRRSC